jgi:hypothetical protein
MQVNGCDHGVSLSAECKACGGTAPGKVARLVKAARRFDSPGRTFSPRQAELVAAMKALTPADVALLDEQVQS